jgi:hypothetical protein
MAIDSGTIAGSGDGSTAPSDSLDGAPFPQVGVYEAGKRRHVRALCEGRRKSLSYLKPFLYVSGRCRGLA